MGTQPQEKQQRKFPYRRRLLIACILIFFLFPFGIVWALSIGHIIDNNLSYLFPVVFSLIGIGLTIYFGLAPASPIEPTAPVSSFKFSQEGEGLVPFNEILERELRKRKLKEEDLAKLMSVSPQEVYRWTKGELEPTNDAYYEILCELFGKTPEEMGLIKDETMGGILRSAFMVDIDRFEEDHNY